MSDLLPLSHVWRDWSRLEPGERKRRAAVALQSADVETLWQLVVAHVQFTGEKGTSVSQHTLRAYERGVKDYLSYIDGAAVLRVSPDEAQIYVRRLEQGEGDTKPKAPATVQLRVIAARRLYAALQWCGFELGVLSPNPQKGIFWRKVGAFELMEFLYLTNKLEIP